MWFVLNLFRESKGWCHPRKIWLFWLSFTLGKNIFSTQTDTKFLYKYKNNLFYCNLRTINVIFFLKTGNLILNWVLLSFSYNDIMPETLLSHSILPNSLVKKGTIWNYNLGLWYKKQFFIFFFLHWEKLRNPARATVIIENKKGSLHKQKASHISNTMNEIFHYLKFYKFINELGKICFVQHWEKLHFETIMNWKCLMFLVW